MIPGRPGQAKRAEAAVHDVLTQNGIDPDDLESRLETAMKTLMSQMGAPSEMGNLGGMGGVGGAPLMGGMGSTGGMDGMGEPPPAEMSRQAGSMNENSTSPSDGTGGTTEEGFIAALLERLSGSGIDQAPFLKSFADMLCGLDIRA